MTTPKELMLQLEEEVKEFRKIQKGRKLCSIQSCHFLFQQAVLNHCH
jgi:hypothetical protein